MAFIYEKMSERDKEFFESFKFQDPLSSYSLAYTPNNWVSDRERGLFLVCLGGQGYRFDREFPPTYYRLIWGEQSVKVVTYDKLTGNNAIGLQNVWDIDRIVAPDTLNIDGELLKKTVRNAIETHNRGAYSTANSLSVKFVSIAEPIFVKGDVTYG